MGGDAFGVAGCLARPETTVCVAGGRALASQQRRLQLLLALLASSPPLMLPSVLARHLFSRQ